VPVDDQYMLSRVDFGKGFVDKTYEPKRRRQAKGFFKGSFGAITGLSKAWAWRSLPIQSQRLHADDVLDPIGLRLSSTTSSAMFAASSWARSAPGSSTCIRRSPGMGRFFGRIWIEDQDGNVVRFNGTYTGPPGRLRQVLLPLR
jgi:hypothetical protein